MGVDRCIGVEDPNFAEAALGAVRIRVFEAMDSPETTNPASTASPAIQVHSLLSLPPGSVFLVSSSAFLPP